ncbi:hypothetical protein ACWC9Q_28300 [Streptomyces sp. NPDC001142]
MGDIGHAAFGLFNGLESGGKHAQAASETAGTSLKATASTPARRSPK